MCRNGHTTGTLLSTVEKTLRTQKGREEERQRWSKVQASGNIKGQSCLQRVDCFTIAESRACILACGARNDTASKRFYSRDSLDVARELLGKHIRKDG